MIGVAECSPILSGVLKKRWTDVLDWNADSLKLAKDSFCSSGLITPNTQSDQHHHIRSPPATHPYTQGMQGRRRERIELATASLLFMLTILITLLPKGPKLQPGGNPSLTPHAYAHDTDGSPRIWEIGALETIHMAYEDTVHYSIETPVGELEWNATLPTGGAVIHLGPQRRPYTVSLFHQLRCLNIIRISILGIHDDSSPHNARPGRDLVGHCMNYLRQMVLCRTDTRLESLRTMFGRGITVWDITHTCRDWTTVYEAAERNYREYMSDVNTGTLSPVPLR
ncbi:hypothetical protein QCA50_008560 [Cerrena zonata]|uniref:Uncharacterized protein n=1 Tax=Cerrena zonata TaxID=2478898 RepID=A0AAW0GAM4_9APHY